MLQWQNLGWIFLHWQYAVMAIYLDSSMLWWQYVVMAICCDGNMVPLPNGAVCNVMCGGEEGGETIWLSPPCNFWAALSSYRSLVVCLSVSREGGVCEKVTWPTYLHCCDSSDITNSSYITNSSESSDSRDSSDSSDSNNRKLLWWKHFLFFFKVMRRNCFLTIFFCDEISLWWIIFCDEQTFVDDENFN